jgi:cell division septation protein DedD
MITFCAVRVALVAALLTLAAGCSREQQDWRSAEAADTSEAYTRFLEQHADSELASQARLRIEQLAEEREWTRADGVASVDAYRQFLTHYPHGKWAEEARIRIEGFSLGSLPRTGQGQATVGARRTGVNALQLATGVVSRAPEAPAASPAARVQGAGLAEPGDAAQPAAEAPEARVAATETPSDGYGVQLGAFGSEASADREWQRLQGRFGTQLGGLAPRIVLASSGSAPLYRLQAPAGGEAQARALCDALRQQSQACVPVIPR